MIHHEHIIGLLHKTEYSELCTKSMLNREIEDRIEINGYAEKYAPELKETVWTIKDYADKRKSTNLTRFDCCPYCGEKINWKKLSQEQDDEPPTI